MPHIQPLIGPLEGRPDGDNGQVGVNLMPKDFGLFLIHRRTAVRPHDGGSRREDETSSDGGQ